MSSTATPARKTSTATPARKSFRSDIQGLRAVAVGVVLLFHLWPNRLTGGFVGVDVFFVISGFLITSHLVKKVPSSGRDFGAFWMRRVTRLLPASFLVLAVTLTGVLLLAPKTVWRESALQVLSSTFYVQNWKLATSSVDYLAQDNAESAVQHFWSLAVEEQFYLIWPLIIASLFLVARSFRSQSNAIPALGVTIVIVLSLGFSVYATSNDPGIAYFSTLTRAWELAAGGALAFLPVMSVRLRSGPSGGAVAWLGLLGIGASAYFYDGSTPFPSYTAALPVIGTMAVIWANATGQWSPAWLLGSRPVRFLGDHSYSVYLWHWPLIVLVPYATGHLAHFEKYGILIATILLAMFSKTFVEDRFRHKLNTSNVVTGPRFLMVGSLILAAASGGFAYSVLHQEERGARTAASLEQRVGPECFGAAAMVNDCGETHDGGVAPEPIAAKRDKSDAYADGCWASGEFKKKPVCTYGSGKTKVALAGNSHAGHWLPALQELAEERDWTITTFLASACGPTDAKLTFDAETKSQGCRDFSEWVLDQTADAQFDLIITSERQGLPVEGHTLKDSEEAATEGYSSYLQKWSADGTPIIVFRDIPYPGDSVASLPDCIAESNSPQRECSGTPKTWYVMDPLAKAIERGNFPSVEVVDMTRFFCTGTTCPAIVGSVIPYFDGSHMTATYTQTMTPYVGDEIDAALKSIKRRSTS